MDRRQIQTLHTVTRVAVQVTAVLLILLVVLGPPGQLGTFLGFAGAGLTVALKDFIVGFIGWFVLMGKNGIRLGDWVEKLLGKVRSEEHTSELQSHHDLVCRLLLEKKKTTEVTQK